MEKFVVALDGPAGSGKSSISEIVANSLGFTRINTGAMYRAIAVYAKENNLDLDLESSFEFLNNVNVIYEKGEVKIDGKVIEEEKLKAVSNLASKVSKYRLVRERMLIFQRASAIGKVILDGRDIGTVVFPDADLKIFLDADIEERAKRRYKELKGTKNEDSYESILSDMKKRDYEDRHREISPLKMANDAILVDTTYLSIDEVALKIKNLILDRMRGK